jgi:hypothetical protein
MAQTLRFERLEQTQRAFIGKRIPRKPVVEDFRGPASGVIRLSPVCNELNEARLPDHGFLKTPAEEIAREGLQGETEILLELARPGKYTILDIAVQDTVEIPGNDLNRIQIELGLHQ